MGKLILIRHGQSLWNLANIFTGWTDVNLAPQGLKEAEKAGLTLKKKNLSVDICFSSFLKRAIRTNWIILDKADSMHIDCLHSWKLNERHYGTWQGRNKVEVMNEVGEDNYWKIRRGYDNPPPVLNYDDLRHPRFDLKYHKIDPTLLPVGESLKDTRKRAVECFYESIAPQLVQDKTILVTAHGNSLRALMAHIQNIDANEIPKITVPTGVPYIFEFDDNLNLLASDILN
tara:strand:+ start:1985 stop:2674 length:690 start_codon:yes stop_codon:yes gene_type:complete